MNVSLYKHLLWAVTTFSVLFLTNSCTAFAEAPEVDQLLKEIETNWSALQSYRAHFEQINSYLPEDQPTAYLGQLWLKRPSRVRLDYRHIRFDDLAASKTRIFEKNITESGIQAADDSQDAPPEDPFAQQNDGLAAGMAEDADEMIYSEDINYIFRYNRLDNTVTKMRMQQDSLPLFLAFLVGENAFEIDRFKKQYKVSSLSETVWQETPCYRFTVVSKNENDPAKRIFWIDKESYLPIRTQTISPHQEIEVYFRDYEVNPEISPEILQGQVPSDVKVIDLTEE